MQKTQCIVLLLFLSGGIYAQHIPQKTKSISAPEKECIGEYVRKAGVYQTLFNGKEHLKYPTSYVGHPFLVTEQYTSGDICCDDVLYMDVPLKFDCYREELVVNNPDQRYNVIVPAGRMQYACLHGYFLFYHVPDGLPGTPPAGYYLQMLDGKFPVWKKSLVKLEKKIEDRNVVHYFVHSSFFYVKKDGVYHKVGSKSSLLRVFSSKKKELNQFIKQCKLKYRNNPEEMIVAIVEQYEKLVQ